MAKPIRQAAALATRNGLICMVTSRNGRRWVIPKGHIDSGHTAPEAAQNEAWEEAGLVGIAEGKPIGTYEYEKYNATRRVDVYLMSVTEEFSEWPESEERIREWVTLPVALHRIAEPELRDIVRVAMKLQQESQLESQQQQPV